jgi:hypothetical protein
MLQGTEHLYIVPLPKAAAWLNLIEGFWKILSQRALAGRACTSTDDVEQAVHAGVGDRNRQPTPVLGGRPSKPRRQLKHQYIYLFLGTTRASLDALALLALLL